MHRNHTQARKHLNCQLPMAGRVILANYLLASFSLACFVSISLLRHLLLATLCLFKRVHKHILLLIQVMPLNILHWETTIVITSTVLEMTLTFLKLPSRGGRQDNVQEISFKQHACLQHL